MKDNPQIRSLVSHSLQEAKQALDDFLDSPATVGTIAEAAQICAQCLQNGHKILSCGNGGSLCDATHFAEELTGRYRGNRCPLPAIAMNDPAFLTCTANDFDFQDVFARYVEGVGHEGDVLLSISTSGTSENILRAVRAAKRKGMMVIALTSGADNSSQQCALPSNPLVQEADCSVCAPRTPHSDRIQEIHIKVIHILIESIESILGV